MHLAVLASPDSWYLHDLRRASAGRHRIEQVSFRQLTAGCGGGAHFTSGPIDLAAVDAVLVRTMSPGTLEQVVFRMDVLARLEAAGRVVINPPRAVEAAVDKYLTTARLEAAGLVVPRTIVCQTRDDALAAFAALGGDVVVKPLFGSEGRGITRIADEALAERAFNLLAQLGAVLYVQEFIPHEGFDIRVLLVGDDAWTIRRHNTLDWRTNVSRGAKAEALASATEFVTLARRAAEAVGAPLAGVDLLPGQDGRLYAIEVNAIPGWQALGRTLEVDIAARVLEFVERLVRKGAAN